MRLYLLILLLFVSFLTVNCGKSKSTSNTKFDKLVWSDEFNENGAINTNKWFHQRTVLSNSFYSIVLFDLGELEFGYIVASNKL